MFLYRYGKCMAKSMGKSLPLPVLSVSVLLISALCRVVYGQDPVTRLEFFDRAENLLLYVENRFDAQKLPSGREVFAPDGFFFRSTAFESSSGRRVKETSSNFDAMPAGAVRFTYSGDRTTFAVHDEFDAVLFQAAFTGADRQPAYQVADAQGRPLASLKYQYDADGAVSRIEVLEPGSVAAAFQVKAIRGSSSIRGPGGAQGAVRQGAGVKGRHLRFVVPDGRPATVSVSLYDLEGRLTTTPVSRTAGPGSHSLDLRDLQPASGGPVRIFALAVDGRRTYQGLLGSVGASAIGTPAEKAGGAAIDADPAPHGIARSLAAFADERDWVSPALVIELLFRNRDLDTPRKPLYASPGAMAVSPDKKTLYVALETCKRLSVVDVATRKSVREVLLPNHPTGIAVSRDGAELYVTCASDIWPSGFVHVIDATGGTIRRGIAAGHSTRAPVLSPDGATLYVCNWFDNAVGIIDLAAGRQTATIPVVREPYSAAITPDGAILVVANSLPLARANDPDTSAVTSVVSLINTASRQVETAVRLPMGSHSLFGTTISPDGKYAFVTHLVGKFNIIADQLTGGWVHTNNCAIIDIAGKRLHNSFTLDQIMGAAANPWGVVCTPDGVNICVVHSGSCEVSVVNRSRLMDLAATKDLSHDLAAFVDPALRRRVRTRGKGPRNIAVVDRTAFVGVYFSDSLEIIDLDNPGSVTSAGIPLTTPKAPSSERLGERHFFDGSLCFQSWQSCGSCHPFTRPDALNWILARMNNAPKNAKSMLYSHYTPPTGWAGRRENTRRSIEAGIEIELMMQPDPVTVGQIDSFFSTLRPVASPLLKQGRLSEAARRGRELFQGGRVDCKFCHSGPLYTNQMLTQRFVNDPWDPSPTWCTPSLNEAWRTAPYDHLGSTLTVEEAITLRGHSTDVSRLSRQDLDDLIQYVLSL